MIPDVCLHRSEVKGVGCADHHLPHFFFGKDAVCESVRNNAAASLAQDNNQNEIEVRCVVQGNEEFHVSDWQNREPVPEGNKAAVKEHAKWFPL